MKLVIDTNVLVTYFWPDCVFRRVLLTKRAKLIAPEYALVELRKHQDEITKKARITKAMFDERTSSLKEEVVFIPVEMYKQTLNVMKERINSSRDVSITEQEELLNDIDFLALAEENKCQLWSNDILLKKQKQITVLNTK